MRHQGPMVVLLAILLVAGWSDQGLAQAGNEGGVIGNRGKSAGGQSQSPAQAPAPRRSRPKAARDEPKEAAKTSSCGNFFGTWTSGGGSWLYGPSDTVFSKGGTARHNSGIQGTWSCEGAEIVLHWKNWADDRLVLSADGKRLNSVSGGKGFTR